jgi:hypothetical protein
MNRFNTPNKPNKAQLRALFRLYNAMPICAPNNYAVTCEHQTPITYKQFRRCAYVSHMDCMMIQWCGMWVGIELDGYTHT